MYTVQVGRISQEYTRRAEAIKAARNLSNSGRRPVVVRHRDGREQMTYRHGQLEEGVRFTPDRRSSTPSR
jgi:hypothetical protein